MKSDKISYRVQRVAQELRRLMCEIVLHHMPCEAGMEELSVSVINVTMSPDLQNAKVFISINSDHESSLVLNFLEKFSPYFRHMIAENLRVKYVPMLRFFLDDSVEYGDRIEKILEKIKCKEPNL